MGDILAILLHVLTTDSSTASILLVHTPKENSRKSVKVLKGPFLTIRSKLILNKSFTRSSASQVGVISGSTISFYSCILLLISLKTSFKVRSFLSKVKKATVLPVFLHHAKYMGKRIDGSFSDHNKLNDCLGFKSQFLLSNVFDETISG